jgi:hypothetical protein
MSPPPRAIPRQRLLEVCDTTHRLVATAYAAYFCLSQGGDAEATVGERERLHEVLRRLVKECVGRMPDGSPATPQEAEVGDALRAVAACCQIDGQGTSLDQFDGLWHAGDRLRNAINTVPVSLLEGLEDAVAAGVANSSDSERAADTKTDTQKKLPALPESQEVNGLIRKINKEWKDGVTLTAIALDFTDGDERRAKSLLRQARRYKHLWKT